MKKGHLFFLLIILNQLFTLGKVQAQQQLQLGTDIPLQYAIGYNYMPYTGVGGGLRVGLLTEPHSSIILSAMETLGVNKSVVELVRDGFKMGLVIDGSADWNWKKNYVGANLIFINLQAGEAPTAVIDDYYGLDLISYWNPLSSIFSQEAMQVNLSSNLLQLGMHYGRRFPINDRLEFHLELGLSKNIGSTNKFTSDYPYPPSLFSSIDEDLQENFKKYAIIPSLGLYLVYNL